MITSLTLEQKKKMGEYRDKYINIGLSTSRIDRDECRSDIGELYTFILKRNIPKKVFICDSPYQLWRLLSFYALSKKVISAKLGKCLKKQAVEQAVEQAVQQEVWQEVEQDVEQAVEQAVRQAVRQGVGQAVGQEVWHEVWHEVRQGVGQAVQQEVGQAVGQAVGQEVWHEVGSLSFIYPYLYGAFDSYFFSYYSFFLNECDLEVKCKDEYLLYEKLCKYSFIYPLKNVCFVSEKPTEIYRKNKKLHADGKPALKYADGFSLWQLDGIAVPKWLVMTQSKDLDIKKCLALENVEQRAQAIKKIGVERLESQAIKIDERKGDNPYTLYDFGKLLDKGAYIPYLKMRNPSVPLLSHFEPVSSDCRTIEHANNWRVFKDINKAWLPCEIT